MSDPKSAAPIVEDHDMIQDTNTVLPTQHSNDIMSNDDQQISGVIPIGFDFNSISATQDHGALPNYSMSATQDHGAMPDYSMFEAGTAYDYSVNNNMMGDDMAQSNHFSGDFQEALDAKTPGYPSFDTETGGYYTGGYYSSDVYNSSSAQVGHDFQPSHGAQTPFGAPTHDAQTPFGALAHGAQTPFGDHTNTFEAKTPFVAAIPFTSPHMATAEHSGEMAPLNLDVEGSSAQPLGDFSTGAQPSEDFFTGTQPSNDFSGPQTSEDISHTQPSDNVSGAQPSNNLFFPGPSPMDYTFPVSGPSSPAAQPVPTMKAPTSRKAKTKALTAIAGDEDSDEETRSLLTSRGKGKAKVQTATADDEQDAHDHDDETPAVGSSNKGKGRKGALTKTPTDTPSKRSRAAAAKKATKATAAGLNTMGHQRVRQVSCTFSFDPRSILIHPSGRQEWYCPDQAHPPLL
jgi:hypothetical protein